jgi:hypothetical protein
MIKNLELTFTKKDTFAKTEKVIKAGIHFFFLANTIKETKAETPNKNKEIFKSKLGLPQKIAPILPT